MTAGPATPLSGVPDASPWLVLIVDEDPVVHDAFRRAAVDATFLGRPVELVSAASADEMEAVAAGLDPARFAVAIVGMKEPAVAVERVSRLRERFGSSLQLVLHSDLVSEELALRHEISGYLAKQGATPERLRILLTLGIRNFRSLIAMRVLCDNLNDFVTLFDRAQTTTGLDQLLENVLRQNAAVWQFDYVFIPDLAHADSVALAGSWQGAAVERLHALAIERQNPVGLTFLSRTDARETWGCVVQPLGRHVQTGLALCQAERPNDMVQRDLRVLLRSWALTRESVELRQIAAQQRAVHDEMHRDRRESIARMVAGVAHDVNTPLGVANTAAAMVSGILASDLFDTAPSSPELADDVADARAGAALVQRNIARAGELIRNFYRLSVGQLVDRREELDLLRTVQEIVGLWGPEARKSKIHVNVHDELSPGCRSWVGYLGHLSQVLLNLFVNAQRYAYPEGNGGTIDVYVRSGVVDGRAEFVLEVRDQGRGIPEENLSQIFVPFFTTGHSRGGTGLGLAILHNIVTTIFGGTVRCESEPGLGAAFVLRFSHCVEQRVDDTSDATAKGEQDELEALEQFIELQRQVATGRSITPEQQGRLAEVRTRVESYMHARYGGQDRRGAVRVPIHRIANVTIDDETAPAEVRDISLGGAMLLHHRRVAAGSPVGILYSGEPALKVHGHAVSCTPMPRREGVDARWQLGVRFAPLGVAERRSLNVLVARSLLEGLGVDTQSWTDGAAPAGVTSEIIPPDGASTPPER